jgi:hypothetical protein
MSLPTMHATLSAQLTTSRRCRYLQSHCTRASSNKTASVASIYSPEHAPTKFSGLHRQHALSPCGRSWPSCASPSASRSTSTASASARSFGR